MSPPTPPLQGVREPLDWHAWHAPLQAVCAPALACPAPQLAHAPGKCLAAPQPAVVDRLPMLLPMSRPAGTAAQRGPGGASRLAITCSWGASGRRCARLPSQAIVAGLLDALPCGLTPALTPKLHTRFPARPPKPTQPPHAHTHTRTSLRGTPPPDKPLYARAPHTDAHHTPPPTPPHPPLQSPLPWRPTGASSCSRTRQPTPWAPGRPGACPARQAARTAWPLGYSAWPASCKSTFSKGSTLQCRGTALRAVAAGCKFASWGSASVGKGGRHKCRV